MKVISLIPTPLASSGAGIPNAAATITNKATNTAAHVVSTSSGEDNAPNLPPGSYMVDVQTAGFASFKIDNVTLPAAATARADATLRVGTFSESIEVSAQTIQMQTDDAKS